VPVLVQEMLSGNREFLAGMTRFAGFGPGVVFGLGGVFTEIYNDTTLRLAPLADADARKCLPTSAPENCWRNSGECRR
jgi:acyl-CoA synthetase (NDP forming)